MCVKGGGGGLGVGAGRQAWRKLPDSSARAHSSLGDNLSDVGVASGGLHDGATSTCAVREYIFCLDFTGGKRSIRVRAGLSVESL